MLGPDFVLDAAARDRLLDRFGAEAGPWCDALPRVVDECCRRWDLQLDEALSGGTSRVFIGRRRGGVGVVLKLTPDRTVADTEALALHAWAGTPQVVDLLDADPETGALLLEKVEPGAKLSDQPGLPSFEEIARLLASLRVTGEDPLGQLPTVAERVEFLFALIGRRRSHPRVSELVPPDLVARGHRLARDLAADGAAGLTPGDPGLVHGDLGLVHGDPGLVHGDLGLVHGDPGLVHGDLGLPNVLDGGPGRGLVAIDPRPCRGDRTVDAIDWAVGRTTSLAGLRERIERLGALVPDLNGDRLEQWCQATAVINVVQTCYRRPPDKTTRFLLQLAASVPG
jgi:streptomycin 6-kinase